MSSSISPDGLSNRVALFILCLLVTVLFSLLFLQVFPGSSVSWKLPTWKSLKEIFSPQSTWLIATMSPAWGVRRRSIIRATWQRLYRDIPMTTRFVLADVDPLWRPVITAENRTYGDIIVLEGLPENRHIANTIKTMEFFKRLLSINQQWTFVSKIDDDSFLNARAFWEIYLHPLVNQTEPSRSRTIIGRNVTNWGVNYPGGQFYTMTWDIVLVLASLQARFNITDTDEDLLVGKLLNAGREPWNFVTLPNPVAFDYDQNDALNSTTAWAKADSTQDAWSHALGEEAINPHKMKEPETYLRVAACFDEMGLKAFGEIL
jgi:hypothetical protein